LVQDRAIVQDFRVTKVQKSEKKEREVSSDSKMRSHDSLSTKDESYVRSLRKKLREIEVLMNKQREGVELKEAQLEKISTLDEIIAKLQKIGN
jgi:uncharacterized protein with WD repeat